MTDARCGMIHFMPHRICYGTGLVKKTVEKFVMGLLFCTFVS